MNNQNFLWVWIKSDESELAVSVHLVRKHYPNAVICLVGDKPSTVHVDNYIAFKQVGTIRASRVTSAVLHAAALLDSFVLMYDDIFLNSEYDFTVARYKGDMKRERPNGNYQRCIVNSRAFLEYHDKPTLNYECHNPQVIDSKKLIDLFELVNWLDTYHLIKSIYFNWYKHDTIQIRNLKTAGENDAKKMYEQYRCFSSCAGLRHGMKMYIKGLKSH